MANTTRTRAQRLSDAFDRFLRAAEFAKLSTPSRRERWNYSTGSRTYGNTFKLYQLGADTRAQAYGGGSQAYPYGSGHYRAAGLPEFLGWTTDEAIATLDAYSAALNAVTEQRSARS